MIAPNMATMLAFIVTDAKLPKVFMNSSLLEAVEGSFNSITIDGCMSTNDTVFLMANGQAKNDNPTKADLVKFKEALNYVCLDLAKKIVQDAEGATKFVEINISGARNKTEAKKLAFGIANSALLKTAIFGENENWGRIAAAAGSAGVKINPDKMKIKFTPFKNNSIKIDVNLNQGKSGARVYTSDLSLKYVRINAGYN